MAELSPHAALNRDYWNGMAEGWVAMGEELWATPEPRWGVWGLPVPLLPEDMSGLDAIELGCGTGYVSGWMARRGARVTALDVSAAQLATARRLAAAHGAQIDFVEASAEAVPRPDQSFDFAISEYGAAIWCDPEVWLAEAWRLLRPGGRLAFFGNHPLAMVCTPPDGAACDTELHADYRTLGRMDWSEVENDPGGIEFNLPIAGWMELFARLGFAVDGFHELYAPDGARDVVPYVTAAWARRFPFEMAWRLTKPA